MEYKIGVESTKIMKTAHDNRKIQTPDTVSSISELTQLCRMSHEGLQQAKASLDKEISDITMKYVQGVAREMISERRSKYADKVNLNKRKLREKCKQVFAEKRAEMQRYFTEVPSEDLVRYLQIMSMRNTINDAEWQVAVKRVADSGNYLAQSLLHDIADKTNRIFEIPIDPDSANKLVNDVEQNYQSLIENIERPEKEWSYVMTALLADYDNEIRAKAFSLDTEYGIAKPDASQTLYNRLKEASQKALHNGRADDFNQIWEFIKSNTDKLQTPEQAEREFIESAEAMISLGNGESV